MCATVEADRVGDSSAIRRTRERLFADGAASLTDGELVVVLVGESGAEAIDRWAHGCYGQVYAAHPRELLSLPGVGSASAARILAGVELGARRARVVVGRPLLGTPAAVVAYCAPLMAHLDREHFWMLALDTKNRLIRHVEVSVGIIDATMVHPREVFKDAIRLSAVSIVVVHNHPSGDPQPSRADIRLTRRLAEAGEVIGIALVDHVIVSPSGIGYSLREHGELT